MLCFDYIVLASLPDADRLYNAEIVFQPFVME